jgi:hypothetical protein
MNEKLEQFGKWLAANAPQVGIGAAVVLLLGVGYYFYADMNAPAQPVPDPPVQVLNTRLSEENQDFKIVSGTMLDSNPNIEGTHFAPITQMNMFDRRSVEAQRERDRAFNSKMAEAEQYFAAGQLDEALRVIEDVLSQNPLHHRATVLKNEIERAQQPAPAEPVEDPSLMGDPMLAGPEGQPPGM